MTFFTYLSQNTIIILYIGTWDRQFKSAQPDIRDFILAHYDVFMYITGDIPICFLTKIIID